MTSSRDPEYYSPLSSNNFQNGVREPSACAFSSTKVTYSKETRDFVKLLMDETRLTTSQRKGFQSLLRSGEVTPKETPSTALARRQEYLRRRVEKGRAIGLDIPSGLNVNKFKKGPPGNQMGGGRRSLETIKATGVLDCPTQAHAYVPVRKDEEKVRFSYKMAYGQEPSQEMMDYLMGKSIDPKKKVQQRSNVPMKSQPELNKERLDELIEEIRDRVDFMEVMNKSKRKEHQGHITYQIREKLDEVKGLCPDKVPELVQTFDLAKIDPLFGEM